MPATDHKTTPRIKITNLDFWSNEPRPHLFEAIAYRTSARLAAQGRCAKSQRSFIRSYMRAAALMAVKEVRRKLARDQRFAA